MPTLTEDKRLKKIPKAIRDTVKVELNIIAKKIKTARESLKMNQSTLAEIVGVETSTIQGIEYGRSRPSLEVLLAIVKALNLKLTIE